MFKLPKPNYKNIDLANVYASIEKSGFNKFIEKTYNPSYLFWNKIKYIPRPSELSDVEFWKAVKILRNNSFSKNETPIQIENGNKFHWLNLERYSEFLNEIDSKLNEYNIKFDHNKTEANRFIKSGIIEEAIASSQIEGANTTRKIAKELILKRGFAHNTSEQMILNNYNTISLIEQNYKNEKLDIDLLLSLHVMLLKRTIDERDIGRFRTDGDNIVVSDAIENITYHVPPKESFLNKDIINFIKYSNDELVAGEKTHPVIKAIIIHFWIGYLHPFVDGNGRMARAMFYWYLLRKGYWFFSYFPLSTLIKKSKTQYRDAYIFSEQDDNDLTYFIDYNLKMIKQSIEKFEKYLEKKQKEKQLINKSALRGYTLNKRQLELLQHISKRKYESTTISEHVNIYQVSLVTARKDLYTLKEQGFLTNKKIGKYVHYYATEKVNELFE